MFGQGSFINSASATPEEIARKRAEIAAMMPRFGNARYVGEGLGQLFMGIGLGRQQKALDGQEREGRASAQERFNAILGGDIQGRAQPGGFSVLGSIPLPEAKPNSPEGIAADTMAALGKAPTADTIRDGLIARGLPPHIADGFVMNMKDESGLNPGINEIAPLVPGSRGGFGLSQWTGPRRVALEEFAAAQGKPVDDWNVQLDFLMQELQGPEAAAWAKISQTQDPGSAAAAIATDFLRPAQEHLDRRVAAYTGGMNSPQMTAAMIPTEELIALASNGYLNPEQRAMAQAMLDQQMKMNDPAYTMGLRADELAIQKAQMEIDQMRNPQPEFTQLSAQEVAALGLPPGVYQRGPDGRIDTIEKTQAPADPIAELRARATAAGLQEGTPEFQAFMLSGGKQQDGMVIESDGQGGFRMVQGVGASGAAAKPFTESQSKDVVYATRAKGALAALDPIANALTDRTDVAAGYLPFGLGGGMQNEQYQVAKTAGDEFLQAILRKDTGAAITADEQALYGETYLPQPGDNEARLAYKAEARQRAIAAIEAGMSPAQIIAQEKALADESGIAEPATPASEGAATGPSVADIGKMTMQDLLRIDVNTLTDEQMDAMMKRFDEVNK